LIGVLLVTGLLALDVQGGDVKQQGADDPDHQRQAEGGLESAADLRDHGWADSAGCKAQRHQGQRKARRSAGDEETGPGSRCSSPGKMLSPYNPVNQEKRHDAAGIAYRRSLGRNEYGTRQQQKWATAGSLQHAAGRLERPAGAQRLPADDPSAGQPRIAYIGHHGGTDDIPTAGPIP